MRTFLRSLFVALIAIFGAVFTPTITRAEVPFRDPNTVTDWYIHSMQVDITAHPNSSLTTKETIVADVGNVSGKHGIYVILPTRTYLTKGTYLNQPVKLRSITDENGREYKYSSESDPFNHTTGWKIGDADVEVTGIHTYAVTFDTRNATRFDQNGTAELYWDVLGDQWQLPIDNFTATISFPDGFDYNKGEFNLYGEDVTAEWLDAKTLKLTTSTPRPAESPITISVTQPAGLFTKDASQNWWYGSWYLIIPIGIIYYLLRVWKKYGQDPTTRFRAVAPEFDVPEKLDPLTLEAVLKNGTIGNTAWSAGIIALAVDGYLTINQEEKKLFHGVDYTFTRTKKDASKLKDPLKKLLDQLFNGKESVTVSSLKNSFYKHAESIKDGVIKRLETDGYLDQRAGCISIALWVVAIGLLIAGSFFTTLGTWAITAWIITEVAVFVFAIIMPRRPEKSWLLYKQIKGFQLYMNTAERYRQKFFEDQNLWERLLPYAILFGLANKWNGILKDLTTDQNFHAYTPVWWMYGGTPTNFNVDSFTNSMQAVSSAIGSSLTSSPSGSGTGGGGFAGGGGGGGGGGGW